MSLYSQSTSQRYGYPYNTHHQQGYSQVPPVPVQSMYGYGQPVYPGQSLDPGSFRRDFTTRLSELTVNSRPIIQNLSMMAQNFTRYSDIVAECLQAHIRRVPPWMKLPAFYVLDAISKNVFVPYASRFSAFVPQLFLETHKQVDVSTKSKMEEMLVTWRSGAPNGKELFGVAAQVTLERAIWGNDSSSIPESSSRRQGHPVLLSKSQVLAELDVTLALKEQATQANPYDSVTKNQVDILHKLRRMVEIGVSQEELQQILSQLRAMSRGSPLSHSQAPHQVNNHTFSTPPLVTSTSSIQLNHRQHVQVPHPLPMNNSQASVATSSLQPLVASSSIQSSSHETVMKISQQPNSSLTSVPSISGISNLFESLVKAGLVSSSNSTPVGAGSSSQVIQPALEVTAELGSKDVTKLEEEEALESQRRYARSIFSMQLRLSTADISRARPPNISLLYEKLPNQCRQCALRFSNDNIGKKKMQDHLDLHYRQNIRAKEAAGRGHSRSWFLSAEDWILDSNSSTSGRKRHFEGAKVELGKNAQYVENESALQSSTVVIPPGDEAKSVHCPVCKESLKSEFREDDEEWIWLNAIRVKDKIYHATCHSELASKSIIASKIRDDTDSSRHATPERMILGTPTTPQRVVDKSDRSTLTPERKLANESTAVAGTKRKAEDHITNNGSSHSEDNLSGTPPQKKIILSTA